MDKFIMDDIILNALKEDIGSGDITSSSTIPPETLAEGRFWAKEDGIICGVDLLCRVFTLIDKRVVLTPVVKDRQRVQFGDTIALISGPARSILKGERVGLNFIQRLSGIATRTSIAVEAIKGTTTTIADTRKTTPGLRVLDRYAVKCGGGSNHRYNLSGGILIKDNHIIAAGGIASAVANAREHAPHTLKIEVEVKSFAQIDEALNAGADIIMLDNMDIETIAKAVKHINGKAIVEASGNMGTKNLKEVADTGVDIISIGALTHTVRSMDISLDFKA